MLTHILLVITSIKIKGIFTCGCKVKPRHKCLWDQGLGWFRNP